MIQCQTSSSDQSDYLGKAWCKAGVDSTSGVGADLSKLRVLDAVIKETLRLHGPAPIGTVRYGIKTSPDALLITPVP